MVWGWPFGMIKCLAGLWGISGIWYFSSKGQILAGGVLHFLNAIHSHHENVMPLLVDYADLQSSLSFLHTLISSEKKLKI